MFKYIKISALGIQTAKIFIIHQNYITE